MQMRTRHSAGPAAPSRGPMSPQKATRPREMLSMVRRGNALGHSTNSSCEGRVRARGTLHHGAAGKRDRAERTITAETTEALSVPLATRSRLGRTQGAATRTNHLGSRAASHTATEESETSPCKGGRSEGARTRGRPVPGGREGRRLQPRRWPPPLKGAVSARSFTATYLLARSSSARSAAQGTPGACGAQTRRVQGCWRCPRFSVEPSALPVHAPHATALRSAD